MAGIRSLLFGQGDRAGSTAGERTEPGVAGPASHGRKASAAAWAILAAMGLGSFLAMVLSAAVGPALPGMKADLGLSLSAQLWTITVYNLTLGAALVAGGRMGDLAGEVNVIVGGFIICGAGVVMSAIAAGGPLMVSGRAIQGIGAGIAAPATLSIVVHSFPVAQRGFAVAVWGFAHGFGVLAGPLFAAWMIHIATWRWVFWATVPIVALVIIVTCFSTRGYKSLRIAGNYDWLGLITGGGGVTLVIYGLQNSSSSWNAVATWGALTAGVSLLAVFGYVETKRVGPLVDFSLWRERLFLGGFFAGCALGVVYIPFLICVGSLFLINVLGYSPAKASWCVAVTTSICMLSQPPAGKWVDKVGTRIPITLGLVVQAAVLAWIGLRFGPGATLTQMVIPLALMGIGVGISLPGCFTVAMSAIEPERSGMASGLIQMTFNIPAALGMAVVTSIIGATSRTVITAELSSRGGLDKRAISFAHAVQDGHTSDANAILTTIPSGSAEVVKRVAVGALSAAITTSMLILGAIALAGAVFTWLVIGSRGRRV